MKVISLWQPYATLIASGAKRIETRSWEPRGLRLGQLVAIHAAKRWTAEERAICQDEPFKQFLSEAERRGLWNFAKPSLGCVVAIARFDHAAPTLGGFDYERMSDAECAFGNFAPGRFGWLFSEVRPLQPIPLRGQQGLFEWEPPAEVTYLEPRNTIRRDRAP